MPNTCSMIVLMMPLYENISVRMLPKMIQLKKKGKKNVVCTNRETTSSPLRDQDRKQQRNDDAEDDLDAGNNERIGTRIPEFFHLKDVEKVPESVGTRPFLSEERSLEDIEVLERHHDPEHRTILKIAVSIIPGRSISHQTHCVFRKRRNRSFSP